MIQGTGVVYDIAADGWNWSIYFGDIVIDTDELFTTRESAEENMREWAGKLGIELVSHP